MQHICQVPETWHKVLSGGAQGGEIGPRGKQIMRDAQSEDYLQILDIGHFGEWILTGVLWLISAALKSEGRWTPFPPPMNPCLPR